MKTDKFIHSLDRVAFLLGILLAIFAAPAWGQPAPALRAVVPADDAPEALAPSLSKIVDGQRTISIPGAAWLQLQFSEVRLGPGGLLTITGPNGETQTFSQAQIESWGGLTGVFNGSEVRITLKPRDGSTEPVSAKIKDIVIGLPVSAVSSPEATTPAPLQNLLGPNFKRFIPPDVRQGWPEGAAPRQGGGTEAICGATDDRVASTNPRVGRIMPIGCTGWLIESGRLLTAGHCISADTQTVEFNVPASRADGTTVAPGIRDQYRVIAGSINSQNTGVGNDWAIFEVLPNTQTNLMPAAAQGATFQLSNTLNPGQVRVTGFGVDGPAPNFGAGGARNADNQTQQTHVGTLSENSGGATSGILRYNPDTQGGNSGSPVIAEGTNTAIGIHTNGGCTASGGTNAGTSFRNAALWTAVTPVSPPAGTRGSIWRYTGVPCTGNSCPGWQKFDNNAATVRIAAKVNNLYQLHDSGKIWQSTGAACSGNACPGWKMLDNNPATKGIATDGVRLYQLHTGGRIWQYTGTPCSGTSCPGWRMLDANPATVAIVANAGQLYQLHNTGKIWRYTGTPCSGTSCPGWQMLDNNVATVAVVAGGGNLYQLHDSGKVWRYTGTPCMGNSCPGWQMLDNNPATIAIAAASYLYQLHNSGRVWKYTGVPCSGNSCPGWRMFDNNPATIGIYADNTQLYQLHNTGKIWQSTGAACSGNSCPGWRMVDNNPGTGRVAAAGNKLYQLHGPRSPMTRARICYECK